MEETFPFKEIKKRDGRVVPFDSEKITQAIFKAARAVGGEDYSLAERLTKEVISYLAQHKLPGLIPTVEEIQDVVEKILIERGHARTAKAYILYRDKRTRIREAKSELMDVVKDILLRKESFEEEVGHSPADKMHQIALAASQKYYLDNLLPPEISSAHQKGFFHINHLGYYSKTIDSLQLDLLDFFQKNSAFSSYCRSSCGELSAVLFRLATLVFLSKRDLYGELAMPCLDHALAALIRGFRNRPSAEELEDSLHGFISHLGSLSNFSGRGGVNSSISMGLDTTDEGREIVRILLEGLGKGKKYNSRGMPRYIFAVKKGINFQEQDPNYDLFRLAIKTALKSGNPTFYFHDTTYNKPSNIEVLYFSNGFRVAENRHAPCFPSNKKRGSIAAVTLNLPRLALSTLDRELFLVELDRLLRLAVRQLLHRFEVLAVLRCQDLPLILGERLYLGSENLLPREPIKESLKNGLLNICFTGLPEAVRVLLREEGAGDKDQGYKLVVQIINHMSRRASSFAEEYDLNIVLSGARSNDAFMCFSRKDREEFGQISGITDKEFYSSSFILFQEDEGLENKIALEGEMHRNCPGGYATQLVLLPGVETESVEELLRRLFEADIGYLSIKKFEQGPVT